MPVALNAVLTSRHDIAPGLATFRIEPVGWEIEEFHPGQFAVLGLPGSAPRCSDADPEEIPAPPDKLIRRAYSISSSSLERQYLEFYVVLVGSGALTPRLFALRPGDPLWLGRKITGMFTLNDIPEHNHLVLIATGTGLAPYISMLRSHLLHTRETRVGVLQGARHSWDLGYRHELALVERDHPNFVYLPAITRPQEEQQPWTGLNGRIQEVWAEHPFEQCWGFDPAPEHTHILLCGNPAMIEAMLGILHQEGYQEHTKKSPGQIHLEKYW
jgi:ferredoxin/flavodoxin---NADP+ reductase